MVIYKLLYWGFFYGRYSERYYKNIHKVIGKKLLSEVKAIHCQKIFTNMAEEEKQREIDLVACALNVG